MIKKQLIVIDVKHIAIHLAYKDTKDFLKKAIKGSWINTLKSGLDETKQRGLNYIIDEITETIKVHKVKGQTLDAIISETKSTIASFFYDLPSVDSISFNVENDSEFTIDRILKSFWSELIASPFEIKLVHVESACKFKENAWKRIISKLEQDLNTVVQICKTPDDVLSIIQGAEDVYLLTARPKFFSGVWNKAEAVKFVYYNDLTLKLHYKHKQETDPVGQVKSVGDISCLSQLIGLLEFLRVQKEKGPQEKIIRVGYNFVPKKFASLQDDGRALTPSYPILYLPVDLRFGLNRKIDVLFHKITDFDKDPNDNEARLKVANFKDIYYKPKEGQKIKFLDALDCFAITGDRMKFQETFINLLSSKEFDQALGNYVASNQKKRMEIKVPIAKQITPKTVSDINEIITSHGLKYPIIAKTIVSCSTTESHQMGVALNQDGLQEIENHKLFKKEDHLLQELINHDGRIFKIYVIGPEMIIQQRQSIPNITYESLGQSHFFFDSQKSFNEVEYFKNKISFTEGEIDIGAVKILCDFISKELNITLFGIDIVQESETGVYYLIDINYFPGYHKCKNLDLIFKNHIIQRFGEK